LAPSVWPSSVFDEMDHRVKAMPARRSPLAAGNRAFFTRHRFENDELERLFQRYVFKLQLGSVSGFVALFVALTAALAALSFALTPVDRQPTLDGAYAAAHCLVFVALFVFLAARSGVEDAHLGYVCYAILFMSTAFVVVHLPVSFVPDYSEQNVNINNVSETTTPSPLPPAVVSPPRGFAEADGVWQIMLVIFLVYGMLPLKTALAFAVGVILPAIHLAVSAAFTEDRVGWKWEQLTANLLLFSAVNLVGIFVHNLLEQSQRKAFLDTRNCIAARLEMEDENEKLVSAPEGSPHANSSVKITPLPLFKGRETIKGPFWAVEKKEREEKRASHLGTFLTFQERLLLSVLPQHVAVEMKQDLISPVSGQFHKIYIQRHENVR